MTGKKGLLLTFEGGEGAGKSTLIDRLQRYLEEKGRVCRKTREPGGTPLGEKIRSLLLHQQDCSIGETAELLLYLASRAQQIGEVIDPALKRKEVVLCDRFNDSTIAYQGFARGLGREYTEKLCVLACRGLVPDLTFILDISPEEGLRRAFSREKKQDRLESEGLVFHKKVRAGYQRLAQDFPDRICLIDAVHSPDRVFEQARDRLAEWL